MNVQDYRAAGFNLSIYIDEAALARAEADVKAAYILPLIEDYDEDEDPYKSAIMVLAYLLIMQRSAFATRAGGKQKNAPQSNTPTQAELLAQYAPTADMYLRQIDEDAPSLVTDLCRIYFKSNFFKTI